MVDLTDAQWEVLKHHVPKLTKRKSGERGRPPQDRRAVLNGIFWVLKPGARWQDLPPKYPPYQTCYRYFQQWVKDKVFEKILKKLVQDLQKRGKIDLTETFIDATFIDAKKGAKKSAKPSVVRAPRSWQSSIIEVFQSPYPLKVLHHMRVSLLKKRFGTDIQKTILSALSETKLTILIHSTSLYDDDIESNSLLPIGQVEKRQLKMAELCAATKKDGRWRDSSPGFSPFDE